MGKTKDINAKSEGKKIIFNRIKSVLADKHKTNLELAKELKVTEETISTWCTNSAQPSIKTLFRIGVFLNIDPGDLLIKLKDYNEVS